MRLHFHRFVEVWRQGHTTGFSNGGWVKVKFQCRRCPKFHWKWVRA